MTRYLIYLFKNRHKNFLYSFSEMDIVLIELELVDSINVSMTIFIHLVNSYVTETSILI